MSSQHKILLVGNGGREHAIAWKLSQSPKILHLYVCPGNAGTSTLANTTNVSSVSPADFPALARFASENNVDILLPGPEAPLVEGIVDYFKQHLPHVACFGPSKAAARMEGSKAFSKDFMKRHNIPTAAYASFTSYEAAVKHLDSVPYDVVIKASGLAAGKGVILPATKAEAHAALKDMMVAKTFGASGDEVVIEELLRGHEISILTFSDGTSLRSLPAAQDHKTIHDGDRGPNTGGMGTYAPAPASIVDAAALADIEARALQPTIRGMRADGFPFCGCLFTGLMMTPEGGPRVLEYNVRFGDPETQSLLPLMDTDLVDVLLACATGTLDQLDLSVSPGKHAATVVVAAPGYPEAYAKGAPITLDDPVPEGVVLFHAGTTVDAQGVLRTSGGRVIASTATAESLQSAVDKAYQGVAGIYFEGMQYRRDIGARALR